jgi:DUF438 domain-containing protein
MARPKNAPPVKTDKVDPQNSEEASVGASKATLSPNHLLQLETLSREIEIARLQRTIREQELKNKALEQKVAAFELEALQRAVAQADATHESKKKARNALVLSIKESYGISDNFGYNPETGMIVRE